MKTANKNKQSSRGADMSSWNILTVLKLNKCLMLKKVSDFAKK